MKTATKPALGFSVVALAAMMAGTAAAQPPQVANAKPDMRSAASGLEKEFRALVNNQAAPAWIGYGVPIVAGRHQMCCHAFGNCCGSCRLEGRQGSTVHSTAGGPVKLEGPARLLVLFRVEERKVGKIRTFSEECELDAGGLPFHWLTDVSPAESVELLASFVQEGDPGSQKLGRVGKGALAAIALHADAAADGALERFVDASQPGKLREKAAFWLGAARGRRGYEVLRRLVREDPSERVRKKVVFALSVSKEPEAVDAMIEVARNDRSSRVRGQALFWLAQKTGKRAAGAITDAIENDPETDVKKRAVFALSQLPPEEGVPLLIRVARTNRNPAVRKKAMFWLGQSDDPRALAFFEEVLTR